MSLKKISDMVDCPECEGAGMVGEHKCPLCHGNEQVRRAVAMQYDKEHSDDESPSA